MTTTNTLISFIEEEYSKLKIINNFVNMLKLNAIKQINIKYNTSYDENDFFVAPYTGNLIQVNTEGYFSNGYEGSIGYQVISLNPNITTTAIIYINDFNGFVVDIS